MKKTIIMLFHLAYWAIYILVLLTFNAIMGLQNPHAPPNYGLLKALAIGALLPALITFYSFNTFLFSGFLSKRKILYFVFFGLCISMLMAVPVEIFLYFDIKGAIWNFETCTGIGLLVAGNAFLNGAMGAVMRGFIEWYGDIKVKEDLNKKNYETELALVKSQINPHFLFNTLNNIDMLILKEPQKASSYLNKLSDIMRFMLYETKTEKVPLNKELEYIEKYVELQRIRSSNPAYVSLEIKGNAANKLVEPLLFIPFIENAFKHTENKNLENAIAISFVIEQDKITFECSNVRTKAQDLKDGYGGLGNELIIKRLSLLYPGKHTLKVNDEENSYTVKVDLETT